jgi:hypothetical protein
VCSKYHIIVSKKKKSAAATLMKLWWRRRQPQQQLHPQRPANMSSKPSEVSARKGNRRKNLPPDELCIDLVGPSFDSLFFSANMIFSHHLKATATNNTLILPAAQHLNNGVELSLAYELTKPTQLIRRFGIV